MTTYTIDENRQKVFIDRYAWKDANGDALETSVEQMWKRVADAIASVEPDEEKKRKFAAKFYGILHDFKFVPGGRILAGAGTGNLVTFYNCFVIPSPDDSYEGIFSSVLDMGNIQRRGGGVGVDLSTLRPKRTYVSGTGGFSSGPVAFGGIYSETTQATSQGGSRRGALMLMLRDSHPDIFDFVTEKQTPGRLTGANVSVKISDTFMNAVKRDLDWELRWGDKTYKTVKARELFDLIVDSARKSAEPGLWFDERSNKLNNLYYVPEMAFVGTNPCLHKDTLMVTENGLERISHLTSRVWNTERYVSSHAWKTGDKKVYRLMTKSGFEYVVTADHKFMLDDGSWVEASKTIGKRIKFDCSEKEWKGVDPFNGWIDYRVAGFILGDGGWHSASNRMNTVFVTPEKDAEVESLVSETLGSEFMYDNGKLICQIPNDSDYSRLFTGRISERNIPDWMLTLPKAQMRDLLSGLFSANGCNLKKYGKIQLVSVNKAMLQTVQQMLLLFGIKAKLWYHMREHDVEFSNGTYTCKDSYHLVISRKSYEYFLDTIGFIQEYKNGYEQKPRLDEDPHETVILISELDHAEVWDFTEPELHRGVTSGAVVHNCGEQPLQPWGVCNLGAINLSKFVKNGNVDWNDLEYTVKIATRFLDNVIDATHYFNDENRQSQKSIRRIGLGTMGLADMLLKLKIRYGSQEAVNFADLLFKRIAHWTYEASTWLALEKGSFELFDADKFLAGEFMKRFDKDVRDAIRKRGLRNAFLLTQAPTGSTGLLSGVAGTGIEPVFAFTFRRTDRIGDRIIRLPILDELGLGDDPATWPDYVVTANDLTPKEHIDMQAAIQYWNDSAISKTANMPKGTTNEEVAELYMYAYDKGLKGITVYVDGSREGVIHHIDEADAVKPPETSETSQTKFTKRPRKLSASVYKQHTPIGKAYVTLAEQDGRVAEMHIDLGAVGSDISAIAKGLGITATLALNPRLQTLSHDEKIAWLVKQYTKIHGSTTHGFGPNRIHSVPHAIAKVLQEHATSATDDEDTPETSETSTTTKTPATADLCPECGQVTLVYEEGCAHCVNCGFSKC